MSDAGFVKMKNIMNYTEDEMQNNHTRSFDNLMLLLELFIHGN